MQLRQSSQISINWVVIMKSFKLKLQLVALILITAMSLNAYAAIVGDSDGGAFVTKSEFDALKKNFAEQIEQYNSSIENKIDGAIASYLAGINLNSRDKLDLLTGNIYSISWYPYEAYIMKNVTEYSSGRALYYNFFYTPQNYWGRYSWGYVQNCPYIMDDLRGTSSIRDITLHPKLVGQDDGDEFWVLIPMYRSNFYGNIHSTNWINRWKEFKGVVSTVGSISRCLLNMGAFTYVTTTLQTAYGNGNYPPPQSTWYVADPVYGWYLSMQNAFRASNYTNNWFAIDVWYGRSIDGGYTGYCRYTWSYNHYVGLAPYFDYKMSGWAKDNSSIPVDPKVKNMTNVMYASIRNSTYVGCPSANRANTLTVSYDAYFWNSTSANGEGALFSNIGAHTSGYGAGRNTALSKYPLMYTGYNFWNYTPWYATTGTLNTYKNYTMALAGYDLGMCDGVPLFKATKDGIMTISMEAVYYKHSLKSTSGGALSYTISSHSLVPYLNLKIGNFSGISSANGSTLKLYDYSNKRETSDYAQNLTPFSSNSSTGRIYYKYYLKVKRGDVIYCRLDPRDQGKGIDYAKIANCTATIENE